MSPEERLIKLGLPLPPVRTPSASYVPYRIAGGLLFLSGQTPRSADGSPITGKLGADVSVEEGYEHARACALQLIAAASGAVADLSHLSVVKVFGMVNALPDFKDHPKVINGASDLFIEIFGDKGRHARSAVGMNSLPNSVTVEVDAIFELHI